MKEMSVVSGRMDARLTHVNQEIDAIREEFYDGQTRLREVQGEISVEVESSQKELSRRIDEIVDKCTTYETAHEDLRSSKEEDVEKLKTLLQREGKRVGGKIVILLTS